MSQESMSSQTQAGGRTARRARPLSTTQERIFFGAIFLLGLCLQLAAVLLQAAAG